jgi:outer membrane protein OmpA-like peptidoglycan-associated protein
MTQSRPLWVLPALAGLMLIAAGCATKKYVNTQVGETRGELEGQVDAVETEVESAQTRIGEHDREIGEISTTAQDALDRAIAAGKLAEGKFLYETVLTDDSVRFPFDKASLSDEARGALNDFAEQLRTQNANVYVEIQGHTDATGEDDYNLDLGEARAEAVRRYLNLEKGLPLNRISVISYGEAAPVADNGTREGRAQNRRVALVVLE